jgi:hypothetical protein
MLRAFVIFLLLGSSAFCGTMRHDVHDSRHLEYGKKYGFVVRLTGKAREGMGNPDNATIEGSAVVITDEWVVTAAHVVEFMREPHFFFEGQQYQVSDIIQHPDFKLDDFGSQGDIALCRVTKKIDVKNFPALYSEEDEEGQTCGSAGFGMHGKADSSIRQMDHQRRAGSNVVSGIRDDKLMCDMSRDNATQLEFLPAHGDSGGGLFIKGKLAGIHSFVEGDGKADSSYGDRSFHTRISKHLPWMKSVMGK